MPNKQTLQLLSTAVAIKTNLEYQNKELKTFLESAKVAANRLNNSLTEIAIALESVSHCAPPLGKSETDVLLKSKTNIAKITRELNSQLEKPYLQFYRETNNAHSKIMEKMLIQAGKLDPSSSSQVRQYLNQALDIILEINKQLEQCLQLIDKCKMRLASIDEQFQRLNLPNSIEATTKEIIKLNTSLESLKIHLSEAPPEGYTQQFLPLQQALAKLQQQSAPLLRDQSSETSAVPENSSPRPTIQ